MKLKLQLNRALIVIDAYLRGVSKNKSHINSVASNTVLIVFQQLFGDAVVIQNSLMEYSKIYPKEKGYQIIFLARPSVVAFMREVLVLPEEIKIETVDFKRFLEEYGYYKKVVKQYNKIAGTLIIPGTSMSAVIFASSNDAYKRIGLVRSNEITKPLTLAALIKYAYTEKIRPNKEDMMLQWHRLLLNHLGAKDYQAKLPELQCKKKIINEEKYCVLCPGSSKAEKIWPTKRFSEIADYIIEKYHMNVHLCGGIDELQFENMILSQVKNADCIVSHIGKSGFSEWSAIVQHAELVVGNDSATMHLAAASRRKAICIAGVYDKYQFFPYKVDVLGEKDRLPVTLLKEMPCEWCRTVGYDAGYGNPECKDRIKKQQCALCIDVITVEEVKIEIDRLLGENSL